VFYLLSSIQGIVLIPFPSFWFVSCNLMSTLICYFFSEFRLTILYNCCARDKETFPLFLWRFRSSEIPLKWVSHKFTQPKWRHRNKDGKLYNIFIDILIKLKAVMIRISSQLRCSPAWLTLLSLTSLCLVWLIFSSLSPADVSPGKQHNNRQTRPQQASLKPTQCFGDYDFSNQYHRSPLHHATHTSHISSKK